MFVYTRNKCNKNIIAQLSRRQENQLFCFVQKPWRKPYGLAGGTSSGCEINTNLNMSSGCYHTKFYHDLIIDESLTLLHTQRYYRVQRHVPRRCTCSLFISSKKVILQEKILFTVEVKSANPYNDFIMQIPTPYAVRYALGLVFGRPKFVTYTLKSVTYTFLQDILYLERKHILFLLIQYSLFLFIYRLTFCSRLC